MRTIEISKTNNPGNGGYFSIYDDGFHTDRTLYIEDDVGNAVMLKNEQIGQLHRAVKPELGG